MDPSYDANKPTAPEERQSHPKRKKVIIATVIIAALIVIALITAIFFTRAAVHEVSQPPSDPKIRIDRAGYVNVHESIGDPFALVQSNAAEPVKYQNIHVIDACSLLTLETIKQQGLLISPGTDAGKISRHFFDGSSAAVNKSWLDSEDLARDLNECDYPLITSEGKSNGNLHAEVYQSTYASPAGLRNVLDDYLRSSENINGVAVYNRTNTPIKDERTFYFLEYKGTYVSVDFVINDDSELGRALLESVAAKLKSAADTPMAPAAYAYESSTFDGTFVSACAISSGEDVKKLFTTPASASIHERIAPSVGIILHHDEKENFINNHCIRTTTDEKTAKTFTIETASYESGDGAAAYLSRLKNDNSIKVEAIGDEAIFNLDNSPRNALYFRISSTVITLAISDGTSVSAENYIKRLTPIAKAVIERVNASE